MIKRLLSNTIIYKSVLPRNAHKYFALTIIITEPFSPMSNMIIFTVMYSIYAKYETSINNSSAERDPDYHPEHRNI